MRARAPANDDDQLIFRLQLQRAHELVRLRIEVLLSQDARAVQEHRGVVDAVAIVPVPDAQREGAGDESGHGHRVDGAALVGSRMVVQLRAEDRLLGRLRQREAGLAEDQDGRPNPYRSMHDGSLPFLFPLDRGHWSTTAETYPVPGKK